MDQNGKDDLKTQFITREGTYRLITLSEYSRPNRVGYQSNQNNPQVCVSLLPAKEVANVTSSTNSANITNSYIIQQTPANSSANLDTLQQQQHLQQNFSDKICFNFGKELYVYTYRGVKKNVDLCKPIDKKLYKGTSPSCHDFNGATAINDCAPLLVGFTTGQIQLVQPGKREAGRLYNEERLIDKTKVTCLKWLPKSPNLFLASHSSGHLYLYNEELPCCPNVPNYQNFKTGDGFTILTCKSKSSRNPLYKWVFNTDNCSINEFCFSPCGSMLAIVSQDGFLRVFYYDTMELLGIARSYFGGFLCVCWSPDSKYVVVGGEDDLVTVWSVNERRVVARGQGHRSWVSVVAFDPYTSYSHCDSSDFSDDDNTANFSDNDKVQKTTDVDEIPFNDSKLTFRSCRDNLQTEKISTSYRLGSVGQDTQLCLWDITEDILRQSYEKRHRRSSLEQQNDNFHDDIKLAKVSTDNDNNSSSKINSFRSKFTVITSTTDDGSGSSSNNTTQTTTVSDNNIVSAKHSNSFRKLCSNNTKATIVMDKCVNATISVKNDSSTNTYNETVFNKGNNLKMSESGLNPLNTLTQRLSHFNFVNDKKTSSNNQFSNRKPFIFAKSTNNHATFSTGSTNNCVGNRNITESEILSAVKNSKHLNNILSTYDPMKLIGSGACPRFDECPLLEPLVCKKIAHERLTALIFREDCFLTACQDGFIYTWARPGYSSVPVNSPTAAASGTIV